MADVYLAQVIENTKLSDNVHSITVACGDIAQIACPGQFLHIKCGSIRLLRRPVSICSVHEDTVRFVFEIKGEGTAWLASNGPGSKLDILGPLGNGFTYPKKYYGKIIVVGGGIGSPPMLYAAENADFEVTAVLGFRDKSKVILTDDFEAVCKDVIITTDDGSIGIRGTAAKPLDRLLARGKFDAVFSCGPFKMQRAVAAACEEYFVPCQVSLEERMGCGVGACLVCACATITDGTPGMSRVCADGPVFSADKVLW